MKQEQPLILSIKKRQSAEAMKKFSVELPAELLRELHDFATINNYIKREIVEQSIREFLKQKKEA